VTQMGIEAGNLSPEIRKLVEQMERKPEKEKITVHSKDLSVDLQAGKRAREKELTRDAKAYAAMQQAQMNQHVEERGMDR